jgi:hypothetical protein
LRSRVRLVMKRGEGFEEMDLKWGYFDNVNRLIVDLPDGAGKVEIDAEVLAEYFRASGGPRA